MELQIDQYKTAYVSFSAEINVTTCEHLVATCMNLVRDGFNELYFLFSTPGGSVMHGMNIYNVLRALPARLVFHNVGNVDRSEEHTSELQSLMRLSYAVFCS